MGPFDKVIAVQYLHLIGGDIEPKPVVGLSDETASTLSKFLAIHALKE